MPLYFNQETNSKDSVTIETNVFLELSGKKILSVSEYEKLIKLAATNPEALKLLKTKLFSKIGSSPLFENVNRSVNKKGEKEVAVRAQGWEEALTTFLPDYRSVIANLRNFFEAFLSLPSLVQKKDFFSLLTDHFSQKFNVFHYLEALRFFKQEIFKRDTSLNQGNDLLGYVKDDDYQDSEVTPKHLDTIIHLVVGLRGLYLGDRFISQDRSGLEKLKTFFDQLLVSPSKGQKTETRPLQYGYFSNCVGGAIAIGNPVFLGIAPFEIYKPAFPSQLDWLGDWRSLVANRAGLPFCLQAITANGSDRERAATVVFPVENGLPLVVFIDKQVLARRALISDEHRWTLESLQRTLAPYFERPCLSGLSYPSGTKLMEALLMFDQERYKQTLPNQALGLATVGALSIPRRGWSFIFGTTNRAEKKIYELGIRSLTFRKSEEENALAQVEVFLAGEIKISFVLLIDGMLINLNHEGSEKLSGEATAWLNNLAIFYLGSRESVPPPVVEPAKATAGLAEKGGEAKTSGLSHDVGSNFRVLSGWMPDHKGQWINQDWPINLLLKSRLGADLSKINQLFLTLQSNCPLDVDIDESALYEKSLVLMTEIQGDQREALATLLKILWLRARHRFLIEKSVEPVTKPMASKRLIKAINSGLLGVAGHDFAAKKRIYTVTFVQEEAEKAKPAVEPVVTEDDPATNPIIYHEPRVAESIFR